MPGLGHRGRSPGLDHLSRGEAHPGDRHVRRPVDPRHRRRIRVPLAEWHRRVRSSARRGHRAGSHHSSERRAGGRQVHAAARGRIPCRADRRDGALCHRRGIREPGAAAGGAHRCHAALAVPRGGDRPWHHPRPDRRGATAARDRGLGADRVLRPLRRHRRRPVAGARGGGHAHPGVEGSRHPDPAGRPRHQRRHHRRSPPARTPCGCRAAVRGRPPDRAAFRARAQEPLRLHRRGRLLRDDRRRHSRGCRPERAVPLPRKGRRLRHLRHHRRRRQAGPSRWRCRRSSSSPAPRSLGGW